MLNFWKSVSGFLKVELTSADFERIFQNAGEAGIVFYHIETIDPLTVQFQIRRQDYGKLSKICRKRGSQIKIIKRIGVYWNGRQLLKRPAFFLGLVFLLGFFLMLPTRVLFIEVEGNEKIPTSYVLDAASECGIRFGAMRKEVRSEQMKNALLQRIPSLEWAGVNTRGCVAVISVREQHPDEKDSQQKGVSSIIAARDGIVDRCTALRGNMLCKPGQAVIRGQTLISGYTDCGSMIRAEAAEGEVYARTERIFSACTPNREAVREKIEDVKHSFTVIVGKKRIKIPGNSGNWDTTCGRIYKEYYITLPGGYRLPFGLAIDEYSCCSTQIRKRAPEKVKKDLEQFSHRVLEQEMIAGRILNGNTQFREDQGVFHLKGQYLCHEMIGRSQQEQIGE